MAQGRHFVTTDEIGELVGVSPASVRQSLRRPNAAKQIVAVTHGAWVAVPPEFRAAGAPPPAHFIDPLMRLLGHPYYVGFLSAAALHGASHQAAMAFQVATPAVLRDRSVGAGRLQFVRRADAAKRAVVERVVPTGRIRVSTPEVTVLDLVEAPNLGGGLSNVATVVAQLVEDGKVDSGALADQAHGYPRAVAQRAGHLLDTMADHVGSSLNLDSLRQLVEHGDTVPLAVHRKHAGDVDRRWRVLVNAEIEPDL